MGVTVRPVRKFENLRTYEFITPRQALNLLMSMRAEYEWQEMDGVAVVRPRAAWKDSRNLLERSIPPFSIAYQDAGHAIAAAIGVASIHDDVHAIGPAVSLTFAGGNRLAVLNAIIRAQGQGLWDAGVRSSTDSFVLRVMRFPSGTSLAIPAGRLRAQ
jgi:hypothetical protein